MDHLLTLGFDALMPLWLLALLALSVLLGSTIYLNGQSNTGTTTVSWPIGGGVPNVTPNLTSLQISQAGGSIGPNAKVTIYDGPIASGTVIFAAYLSSPGSFIQGTGGLGGSVGIIQDIPLPRDANGVQGIQALTGNQMNIQVIGTSNNQVSVNARFTDGLR
jgi:hypothetical protein